MPKSLQTMSPEEIQRLENCKAEILKLSQLTFEEELKLDEEERKINHIPEKPLYYTI